MKKQLIFLFIGILLLRFASGMIASEPRPSANPLLQSEKNSQWREVANEMGANLKPLDDNKPQSKQVNIISSTQETIIATKESTKTLEDNSDLAMFFLFGLICLLIIIFFLRCQNG